MRQHSRIPESTIRISSAWVKYAAHAMADYEKDEALRREDPTWAEVCSKVDETVDVDNITSQVLRVSE